MNPWERAIWCASIGLTAAVLLQLYRRSLVKTYRLLSLYLATDFITAIAGQGVPYRSTYYGDYYASVQTLKIAIAALVLVEIYAVALERTPALAQFGRKSVGYILGAAGVLPVVWIFAQQSKDGDPFFRGYLLFEQTMDSTMALFLLLIFIFVAWFPVRMRRNVVVYMAGFIAWWLTRAATLHLGNQFRGNPAAIDRINSVQMLINIGCLLFWLIGLRKEGEARTAVVGHLWDRSEADRLTEQLETINDSLERLRRK